jgi:hypothetical protein
LSLEDPIGLLIVDPPTAPPRANVPNFDRDRRTEIVQRALKETRDAIALAIPLLAWDAHVLVFCNLTNWPAVR